MRLRVPTIAWVLLLAALFFLARTAGAPEVAEPELEIASKSVSNPLTGGSLKVGLPGDLQTLDPHQAVTAAERMVARALTDSLFRFDFAGGLQGAVVSRWEAEEDGLSYVLHLRPDLEFSDGTACDAEAVRDNLLRMREVGPPVMVGSWLSSLRDIEIIDDLELRLNLLHPDPNLLFNLSRAETGLVSLQAVGEMGADFFSTPVGLGPFRVVSLPDQLQDQALRPLPDDQVEHIEWGYELPLAHLVAFESYWGGRAYIDSITFVHVDPGQDPAELLAGDFDLLAEVPHGYEVPGELGYAFTRINLDHHLVALNLNSGPLADSRVRRALYYAVDRTAVIEKVFGGDAKVLEIGDTPGGPYDRGPGHNPEQAGRLLAHAGYGEDGNQISLVMLSDEDPVRVQVSEMLAEQIREIGVDVQMVVVPREEYYDRMRRGDYDISYWVLLPRMVDCSAYTVNLHSDSYWNVSQISRNPDLSEVRLRADDLLQQTFESVEPERRHSLYSEFAGLAFDQQLYLSLWSSEVRGAAVGRLRDLRVPYGFAFDFSRTWLHRP